MKGLGKRRREEGGARRERQERREAGGWGLPYLAGLSKAMFPQILNVNRQHPTRTFGTGRP
jgi:hypothetical protein